MADLNEDWIEWAGGKCPVAPEAKVECRVRDGATYAGLAKAFAGHCGDVGDWWSHTDDRATVRFAKPRLDDIIAYRVVSA
jgi:hypothetical protein